MKTGFYSSAKIFTLISILFLISSCDSFFSNNEKPSNNLITEDEIQVASETISSSGGTVIVDDPSSEIDGMEIMVPEGSYSGSRTFKISTAAITSHNLGQYFNPITPLIQIENGSGYADSILEVTIPITIEDDEIPLGFYYDEIAGTLESIPIKDYTNKSITLFTRHFMPASELSSNDKGLKGIKIDATANLVISSIKESFIEGKQIISSGFKIGVDNWEFVNNGSYLASGGHCAGQNLGAAWYYFEKKLKGEPKLNGRFSTLSNIDQDNAIGYRFCSVLQKDYSDEYGVFRSINWKYISKNQDLDKVKWLSIAGAMLTTGEPQLLGIYTTIDDNKDGIPDTHPDGELKYGGHSIICYQISVKDGKLYICDPNYPNDGQVVEFSNGKFKPYIGKANGQAPSESYEYVTWNAKTALIDWPNAGKRYSQLEDSIIGTVAPNKFPDYTIWVTGENNIKLKDGYTTDSDTFRCIVESPNIELAYDKNSKNLTDFTMYDNEGSVISKWEKKIAGAYTILKPGLNRIGIYITGDRESAKYKDNNNVEHYIPLFIDFKWYNIYYSQLKISPDHIVGEPDKDIEITAMSYKTAPKDAKYVWNFGDGTKEVTVKNDSIVTHKFSKEGDFTVTVDLYDNSTNKIVGHAAAEASIVKGILGELQKCPGVDINFQPKLVYQCKYLPLFRPMGSTSPPDGIKATPIVWNGTSFSVDYSYSATDGTGKPYSRKGSISGTLSADGLTLLKLKANEKLIFTSGYSTDQSLSVENLTLDKNLYERDYLTFASYGTDIEDNVVSFSMKYDEDDYSCSTTSADYTTEDAWLQVSFR
ncbi:MAG: PKD domain-containing protein [Prolixibacteraceae bacterium]|nr:PKD domain-containing protein [Prolixibacteraceae bacterium]